MNESDKTTNAAGPENNVPEGYTVGEVAAAPSAVEEVDERIIQCWAKGYTLGTVDECIAAGDALEELALDLAKRLESAEAALKDYEIARESDLKQINLWREEVLRKDELLREYQAWIDDNDALLERIRRELDGKGE